MQTGKVHPQREEKEHLFSPRGHSVTGRISTELKNQYCTLGRWLRRGLRGEVHLARFGTAPDGAVGVHRVPIHVGDCSGEEAALVHISPAGAWSDTHASWAHEMASAG